MGPASTRTLVPGERMGPTLPDPTPDRPERERLGPTRPGALRVYDPAMAEGRRVGDDTVSWQVTKLAKAHRALVGDALAELGLHLGQDLLLEQLWRQDGLSQSSLVARLGLQRPVRDLRRQVERRLLTGLSDEDRERLVALLARVTANLHEPRYT